MRRWAYLAKRLVLAVPVVLFGTSLTFLLLYAGPVNPAASILGQGATPAEIARLEARLGLNEPLWSQYLEFMTGVLTFGLGESYVISPNTDVYAVILDYAPRTLWMGFWAVLLPLFVGIPLGFYAGLNPNTPADYVASLGGIVWRAMPNFWLAVVLMTALSRSGAITGGAFAWGTWLVETTVVGAPPLDGLVTWTGLVPSVDAHQFLVALKMTLPASVVLGSASMGNEMRIARTAMLEATHANYVELARAKGVSGRAIVWKHVFRNALVPLIPVISAEAFLLVGGSVLVEYVFGINGIGYLFFRAMTQGDIPLAGALMFVFIVIVVGMNVVQDLLYTLVDPRVGYD
ncbi:peptide ABC transporter permease [Halarchaeum grantii]|uniref:Peptide ABC transporter permease n=1 Tax=Halarchaeum grantii TaxID=1193105 RepID=A0A830F2V8_9EURY|nr:ABC transporter permease [Halarchaeum grantii]GGL35247.1 peptide ABC transporter permease [Halarchaeum grantii]